MPQSNFIMSPTVSRRMFRASLLLVLLVLVFGGMFLLGNSAHAFDFGLDVVTKKVGVLPNDTTPVTAERIARMIGILVRPFLLLLGMILFVLIIYAGYLWTTAAGKDEQIDQAKKIMSSAVIGVLIVMAAYFITTLVLGQITGALTATTS